MEARVKIALALLGGLTAVRVAESVWVAPAPAPKALASARASASSLAAPPSAPKAPCPAASLPDHGVCVPVPAGDPN